MHCHFDSVTKTGEMFVNGIVENFEHHVMQTALIRVADVHARAFPDSFQAFQLVDLRGVVFLRGADSGHAIPR